MKAPFVFVGLALVAAVSGFSGVGGTSAQRAPRYLSLLIGVGDYKYAAEWTDLKKLNGPRTDVLRMQHTLRRWGFLEGPGTQRVLVDRQASKAGIERAFRWLATQATETNDVVVIYYSGHGSWARDTQIDAVRTRDESRLLAGDNFDEGLIPWDARDPHNPRHLVLDDEINAWLKGLRTRNVTIIVDACFSGTVTRGSPDPTSGSAPVARGPRPPPTMVLGAATSLFEGDTGMNHTLLTAAAPWELSYEKTFAPGAVVAGIFTRFLAEALDGADRNTHLDELIQQVRAKVGQGQTPQLERGGGARIFRVGEDVVVPARGYALVRAAGPGRVGIDVGALHGVRKGALYDVYGPDETEFGEARLAQVQVDSVFEASAFARTIAGARAIPPSGRAVLSRVPPGAMTLDRLKLFVSNNARFLRDSLANVEWLELTERPARAMAEIRRRDSGYQVLVGGNEVPPLRGDYSVPTGSGSQRGYQGNREALCPPLRRAYAIAALDLVRNDQPPPPSLLKLDVRLLQASTTSPTRTPTTVDTAYVGEPYDIWAWVEVPAAAVQRSRLYLTIAVAGYTAAPRVIVPAGTQPHTPLRPEQLSVPLRFTPPRDWQPVAGIENIKATVSSFPYDLRSLMRTIPQCSFDDLKSRGNGGDTMVVTGWTAAVRRIEFHERDSSSR